MRFNLKPSEILALSKLFDDTVEVMDKMGSAGPLSLYNDNICLGPKGYCANIHLTQYEKNKKEGGYTIKDLGTIFALNQKDLRYFYNEYKDQCKTEKEIELEMQIEKLTKELYQLKNK